MKMKVTPNPATATEIFRQDSFSENSDNGDHDDVEPSSTDNGDFSEYLWMENEEEFDKEVLKQLEEEALMEQCIQAMLEDEREDNGVNADLELCQNVEKMQVRDQAELVRKSTLNPNAAEFVPKKSIKQDYQ